MHAVNNEEYMAMEYVGCRVYMLQMQVQIYLLGT